VIYYHFNTHPITPSPSLASYPSHLPTITVVVLQYFKTIIMSVLRFAWGVLHETVVYAQRSLGRTLREAGLELDRRGSILSKDIAFLEPINRHRNILNIEDYSLAISQSAHIAPNATVFGDVAIAHDSYVGFGAVVDGLNSPVRVGANSKIGDNSTVQSAFWVPDDAFPLSTTIGNNVNIEHSCNITNAIIDDDAHIGFRSVLMEGVQVERG
jgi:gamma-carbonic anhydrase